MTDEEFKTWTRHTADNLIAQRDDALARIDAAESKIVELTSERDKTIASLMAEKDQIVTEKDQIVTAAKTAADAATAKFAVDLDAATVLLNAKITELTHTIAERDGTIKQLSRKIAAFAAEVALPSVAAVLKQKEIVEVQAKIEADKAAVVTNEKRLRELTETALAVIGVAGFIANNV